MENKHYFWCNFEELSLNRDIVSARHKFRILFQAQSTLKFVWRNIWKSSWKKQTTTSSSSAYSIKSIKTTCGEASSTGHTEEQRTRRYSTWWLQGGSRTPFRFTSDEAITRDPSADGNGSVALLHCWVAESRHAFSSVEWTGLLAVVLLGTSVLLTSSSARNKTSKSRR